MYVFFVFHGIFPNFLFSSKFYEIGNSQSSNNRNIRFGFLCFTFFSRWITMIFANGKFLSSYCVVRLGWRGDRLTLHRNQVSITSYTCAPCEFARHSTCCTDNALIVQWLRIMSFSWFFCTLLVSIWRFVLYIIQKLWSVIVFPLTDIIKIDRLTDFMPMLRFMFFSKFSGFSTKIQA